MKIIGKTSNGYICEVLKKDMQIITGHPEREYEVRYHALEIGTTINVPNFDSHIKNMAETVGQRKQAAMLLRSVAEIIETVPDAFTAPKPSPERTADDNLRAALE